MLTDKIKWPTEDEIKDLAPGSTVWHSHIETMSSKREEDYLDPKFTDGAGKECKNDFSRLTKTLLSS